MFYLFSAYQSFALSFNLFLSILHFHVIVNRIVFLVSFSERPLLAYRYATDFYVSILCLAPWLNSFITSNRFSW